MFKNLFIWILANVFKIKTETTEMELESNKKYAIDYESIDCINFNAIFSNKLANFVASDSTLNIEEDNQRSILLNKIGQQLWKKIKKITSMSFGYGGVVISPYVANNNLYYNIIPQSRLSIDKTDGDNITGATILAEKKTIKGTISSTIYLRWTNYLIENGNLTISQRYSDEKGNIIPTPDFWSNIEETKIIPNVDRVPFGFIKSPINNRKTNDKYGVPITYGCQNTILEIKECLKQISREYELKETFVGADLTMFNGSNGLPVNGLYRKIDSGKEDFWEVYDPAFRDYTNRLQELYKRLEHEVGTSYGIISEVESNNATATEIKKALYDTFTIVDDMRSNIEKGMGDFFYACDILANYYSLSPMGEYNVTYDWDYSMIEDSNEAYNQLVTGIDKGVIKKEELRNWLKPTETMEESKEAIDEIKNNNPSVSDLIGE